MTKLESQMLKMRWQWSTEENYICTKIKFIPGLSLSLNVQMQGTSIWDLHQFKFSGTEMLNRKKLWKQRFICVRTFFNNSFFFAIESFVVLVAIKAKESQDKSFWQLLVFSVAICFLVDVNLVSGFKISVEFIILV